MYDDFDRCYRAVQSRDCRFDGWFVTAVLTTGIYCRPSCPVRLPLARNVRFDPTAAAAQRADRGKPMVVEADRPGTVDLQRQVVVFNGNVVITQGTMVLRAERVELRELPDG